MGNVKRCMGAVAMAALLVIMTAAVVSAQSETVLKCSGDQTPRIIVNGNGKVTAKPDEAAITIGVTNMDRSLKRCFEVQTAEMNRVIEEMKKLGVKPDDIRTVGYSITPRSKDQPSWWGGVKPDSYQVAHTLTIKVRDLSKLGDLIDKVVASGATNISGLNFSSSKIAQFEREARVKAVENAKEKAQAMAQGAGVKTGKVLEINDMSGPVPAYRERAMAFAAAPDSGVPQIEPGSIEIEAGCTLITEVVQ